MNLDVFILAEHSGCKHIAKNSRYLGDCCIRYWQGRPWSELVKAIGVEDDEFIINGGIGTLTIRKKGNELHKAVVSAPPQPVQVSAEVIEQRSNICLTCPQYRPLADKCNLCGCGFVVAERTKSAHAKCPEGRW